MNIVLIFSIVRNSCGCGHQPNSQIFIQVFRLLLTSSLIAPVIPRGSNVGKEDPHVTLMNLSLKKKTTVYQSWETVANHIIESCDPVDDIQDVEYNVESAADNIVFYEAGYDNSLYLSLKKINFETFFSFILFPSRYVVKKMERFINCSECSHLLKGSNNAPLISIRNEFDALYVPSSHLVDTITAIEAAIMKVVDDEGVHNAIFWSIIKEVEERSTENIKLVGCQNHCDIITKRIMYFFIVMRVHFISKAYNDKASNLEKIKNLKKKQRRRCEVE